MSKDPTRTNGAGGAESAGRGPGDGVDDQLERMLNETMGSRNSGEDPDDHLDDNSLAMIELDVISQSEREHIVAHIMHCTDCRQLVSEALVHATIPVPARGWSILTPVRRRPLLSTFGVVAAACLMIAVGFTVLDHISHPLVELPATVHVRSRGLMGESHADDAVRLIGPEAKDAVPALIAALKDPDEKVRERAAESLDRIGPAAKDAVPALIAALKDSNEDVRNKAAGALRRIDPTAKEAAGVRVGTADTRDGRRGQVTTVTGVGASTHWVSHGETLELAIEPPRNGQAIVVRVEAANSPGGARMPPSARTTYRWEVLPELRVYAGIAKPDEAEFENVYSPIRPPQGESILVVILTDETTSSVRETIRSSLPRPESGFDAIPTWRARVLKALRDSGHSWASIDEIHLLPTPGSIPP